MARPKLNYRFHNPNTPEETVKYISKVFMEVCQNKLEQKLAEIAEQQILTVEEYSTL